MDWRTLLYPIGFLASIAFSLRFVIQWLLSEAKGESHVRRSFWRLSIGGNILLMIHSIIQIQFHVAIAQVCNFVIARRNIELMSPIEERRPLKHVWMELLFLAAMVTTIFILQGYTYFGFVDWVRTPRMPWSALDAEPVSLGWHILGSVGIFLFASRFWIQWWRSEVNGNSYLGRSFWWLSLIGAVLALGYFLILGDAVNIVGTGFGIIPYTRNLILIHKKKAQKS